MLAWIQREKAKCLVVFWSLLKSEVAHLLLFKVLEAGIIFFHHYKRLLWVSLKAFETNGFLERKEHNHATSHMPNIILANYLKQNQKFLSWALEVIIKAHDPYKEVIPYRQRNLLEALRILIDQLWTWKQEQLFVRHKEIGLMFLALKILWTEVTTGASKVTRYQNIMVWKIIIDQV